MKKLSTVSLILGFTILLFALCFAVVRLDSRVRVLEKICYGQCNYGDVECTKRCQKAGHCDRNSQ